MKKYELKFNESTHKLERISVVETPAVGDGIVYFSKEENEILFFANDEKQIFYSVAMRPNQLIFRNDVNGEKAEVFYTPETVEKMQQAYFKNNGNKETNIDHQNKLVEGVFPFESWIVQNAELDKSKELGLNVRNGDWVMGYKVENPEIWQDVKDGKIGGLSIESSFEFNEVSTNTNFKIEMTKEEKNPEGLWNMLKSFFSVEVEIEDEKKEEERVEPNKEEKPKEEEMAVEPTTTEEVDVEAMKKENADLKMQVSDLQEKLSKAEAMLVEKESGLTEMSKQILEMSKQTSSAPAKKYEEMTNAEKAKFNRGKL
jgi:hypothetical protein